MVNSLLKRKKMVEEGKLDKFGKVNEKTPKDWKDKFEGAKSETTTPHTNGKDTEKDTTVLKKKKTKVEEPVEEEEVEEVKPKKKKKVVVEAESD